MIRHVSVFTLENKEEIDLFVSMLEEVAKCELIMHSEVGVHQGEKPEVGPHFGDVIQIIDFKDVIDASKYPTSKEHMHLMQQGPKMSEVTAIDYELKD